MSVKDGFREQARGLVMENLGIKVLSLVVALGFYAFIHGAEDAERTVVVSVVSLMPADSSSRQLLTPLPAEVRVTLRGSRRVLDDLRADDLGSVRLDLQSGRETNVELGAQKLHVPVGVRVDQIFPSTIALRWDDVVSRSIPVQVARTGDPARGFTVKGTIMADPAAVQGRGPRSIIDVIQFARAAPFDVTGLTEGMYRRPLSLDKPPNMVSYEVDSVLATVEIGRELVKKQFPRLRVEVIGVPRATTNPEVVTVVVTGTAENVNAIGPEAIVPRVEPKGAGQDTSRPGSELLPVVVEVPKGVTAEVEPGKVVVRW